MKRVGFKTLNTVREMVPVETQPILGACSEYQLVQSSVYPCCLISFPISVWFPLPRVLSSFILWPVVVTQVLIKTGVGV